MPWKVLDDIKLFYFQIQEPFAGGGKKNSINVGVEMIKAIVATAGG